MMGIFLRPAPTQGEFDTGSMGIGQVNDRDSSTKKDATLGASQSYDPFEDD